MLEEWRPIPGWEGEYEASNLGQIRSLDRYRSNQLTGGLSLIRGRVLKQKTRHDGYKEVGLAYFGKVTSVVVHRLVALAFIPRAPGKDFVLHGDGSRDNNAVGNLRWGTTSENMRDKRKHGTDPMLNKTHCPAGHPYDESNTAIDSGARKCKTCRRAHARERRKNAPELLPGDPRHGTRTGYSTYKCRCEDCVSSNARYRTARLEAVISAGGLPEEDPRHGQVRGYAAGCRCHPCTTEMQEYERQRSIRRRKAREAKRNVPE